MARKDDVFKAALSGKRIPVLTLDSKWHQLFTQAKPDRRIRRLEEKLNDLLKRQGKAGGKHPYCSPPGDRRLHFSHREEQRVFVCGRRA